MVIAEVSLVPLGTGASVGAMVSEVVRLIRESGVRYEFHAMGTNLEGEWDDVMTLVRRCHERLFELGAPRVSITMKITERRDKRESIESKKTRVRQMLGEHQN
ncbi:MAG: MTH1187 family thiamine-binding protein [Acidobacteriota bacterium]|jgi:uncharacterized protein (TIGR00106 family)